MDLCQSCKDAGTGCLTNPAHNLTVPKVVEKLISTSNEDLEIYVKAVIEDQMPDSVSEDDPGPPPSSKFGRVCHENASLLSEIIDTIVNISKGRFLLAKQYTRSLTSKQTLGAIRRAMRELKKDQYSLAEMIDKMYDDDMAIRIKKQDPEMAKYAIRILAIISTARRNLRLTELQHALATWEEYTTTEYDSEEQLDRQQILDMTKGLVRIDRDKEATVRLDHRTLEEYFQKTRSEHFPDSEADMAKVCLKYLNFNEFARPCNEVSDFAVKEQSHVFISYAVQYWGDHVREAVSNSPSEHEVISIAAKYLQTPLRLEAYAQAAWASSTLEHDKWDVRRTIHPLHVCAWFDLDYLISALDYQTMDLDVREQTYGQTPLMYACRRGNINVARRLMELGASMNLISGRGRTALFEAVLSEQPSLVELLLGSEFKVFDVDVNVKNEKLYNRTALMVAADRGLEDIAHELLKHDRISVNEQDSEGNTALSLACSQGHLNIASALSTKPGINLNIKEKQFGRTALLLAAELNHAEIVDDLLCNGAETDLEDMRGGNAVLRAAEEGGLEALQKLIDYGATVGDEKVGADEEGRTPLHLASRNEHIEVLQILVEKYSNLDIRDDNGLTPLHHTCQSGALETAAFLLEQGADPAILDAFGRTPFVVAWQYGHKDLIDLFREKGKLSPTDLTQSLEAKDLPLWSLVIQRELDCIKAAISANKADVTIKEPGTDNTVLHLALIEREKECLVDETRGQLLRTLLPTAARYIDEPDNCGRSPLHLAALYGSIEATNILLEADPPLDRSDRFGLTPLAIAFRNSFPMAAKLIEAGANIPLSGIDIQKMLFKCILLQNVTAVKFLVAAGADATAPDDFGRTVNQLAKLTGHPALVHIVQSIKSSMWRVKRAETTKTSPVVEVVEILKDMPVDQFPSLSQLPRLPLRSTPILNDIEKTAMYA
jgi:ankyrin repeat protein